ncbi:50S ribosomal protein L18 [Candidatus Falkowbacteria bacterium RIFOXYB2_FULL_34_18]|uniref:Large ribosomal subunit protein uL18 n=1 Tax=Candidatus Falkowbacteria bacterium RIFOXYD2_FULL_34_120 TaxID=1798007 RepID=A0A1F5TSD2_9BACT|nr:MAG: 50S ribosomal protein L18 [Candidatus Falkowbacteria bacterium RIFOXYB2_FULL_34_18]OGF30055.1 MAG: 50S ribosomal protein L18 [Candidatus Falkowbacteria bacterium RIFOXYC12_FULL_34_55]OGF37612.1 MAG: 50S ribosomal protein L18 [Candidatus Falkowbacteria bacterium RIFOXYC2_FULL_34_220]OGF39367.1 MAG: 50S ribosomal protein L18 [Candidatus Falkowbacteria bacterium RIFOXYD12_FULL_34_57]OGF41872.1 MAG: 50S ribosomal protein L18 [Candidatus Falkowbacteria bacterium RIFOXYD2_FULL_34_120]
MNNKEKTKQAKRMRRMTRVRAKISGTNKCPRLSVFKSNIGMYLQLIDDTAGKTIVSAHTREIKKEKDTKVEFELGKLLAKKAVEKKYTQVVFDRGGNIYHGRVKLVAEGAREGGLKF